MKGFHRILVSIYIGIAVYLTASIFFGGSGVFAMRNLESYNERLEKNVEELIDRNAQLESEVESLLTDAERIRLEARVLGYFSKEERVIEYSTEKQATRSTSLGRIMKENVSRNDIRSPLRLVSIAVALACYLALAYFNRRHDN